MSRTLSEHQSLVLYDGVCGLCNRLVQFLLNRDHQERLFFASLQSPLGQTVMERNGCDPSVLNTMFLLERPRPGAPLRLHSKARAATHALTHLGGLWRVFGLASFVPTFLANPLYDQLARVRYRLFGRYDTCPLPRPEWQHRFLDEVPPETILGKTSSG